MNNVFKSLFTKVENESENKNPMIHNVCCVKYHPPPTSQTVVAGGTVFEKAISTSEMIW